MCFSLLFIFCIAGVPAEVSPYLCLLFGASLTIKYSLSTLYILTYLILPMRQVPRIPIFIDEETKSLQKLSDSPEVAP